MRPYLLLHLSRTEMGDYIEHDLDQSQPTKFFLPPLEEGFTRRTIKTLPQPESSTGAGPSTAGPALAVDRRRQVYANNEWARHVAANEWTGYRASLTPRDLQSGAERARALTFLERELRVWAPPHDVPHLARRLVKLFSAVDVRSSAAVRLLEPLVGDTYPHAAEHLAHELAAFLRSPFPLEVWDDVVQYSHEEYEEATRGRSRSRSRSRSVPMDGAEQSRSRGRRDSRSRSRSRSLSGSMSRSRSRSRGRGRYDSFRPRLRSRSRSRSGSPSRSLSLRRWDEADSWVDPDFCKNKRQQKRDHERERHQPDEKAKQGNGQSLLSRVGPVAPQAFQRAVAGAGIVIRGAADRRQSLLDRLARAKAEDGEGEGSPSKHDTVAAEITPPAQNGHSIGGDRAAELREKLLADRKKRQLREQLLARKRARNAVAAAAEDVKARGARQSGAPGKGTSIPSPAKTESTLADEESSQSTMKEDVERADSGAAPGEAPVPAAQGSQ
ncbi:hypothetical protein CcaverHIS002_0500450 [Cutaneotrichosporon cavernicola]|uniref:RING-type E3 ubiquitin transferase n=1 Tax=Cutaneotrichosporon cavernicola TaxID=279322 RepID=A0AA48QXN9_9TREE|nr:uncharacterized protein CcaverHIS019_0600450 [Cutaneotrichosporon cavernicola]BEI84644.1 hypothetical protein CcaverHIS002_0500450 [Cutaneotrichosporon cavernicola]BEI93586.1 hypothetical protein CcaverHIS019_0600450 [Cutaneotrichosporon cavernicola]BEJ01363.1 hypothetical protein CcaverHIS631_0600450 [Cutaneotrichosporon cavernicola]BEJ09130.1 hypothetical protein CcaverHIS641_0600450 [Cutaneotrichosporon cavernicola]